MIWPQRWYRVALTEPACICTYASLHVLEQGQVAFVTVQYGANYYPSAILPVDSFCNAGTVRFPGDPRRKQQFGHGRSQCSPERHGFLRIREHIWIERVFLFDNSLPAIRDIVR